MKFFEKSYTNDAQWLVLFVQCKRTRLRILVWDQIGNMLLAFTFFQASISTRTMFVCVMTLLYSCHRPSSILLLVGSMLWWVVLLLPAWKKSSQVRLHAMNCHLRHVGLCKPQMLSNSHTLIHDNITKYPEHWMFLLTFQWLPPLNNTDLLCNEQAVVFSLYVFDGGKRLAFFGIEMLCSIACYVRFCVVVLHWKLRLVNHNLFFVSDYA